LGATSQRCIQGGSFFLRGGMSKNHHQVGFDIHRLSSVRAFVLSLQYFLATKVIYFFLAGFTLFFVIRNVVIANLSNLIDQSWILNSIEFGSYGLVISLIYIFRFANREKLNQHMNHFFARALSVEEKETTGFTYFE
jgi:hypothetical protein